MELSKTKNEAKGAGFFLRLALVGALAGASTAAWLSTNRSTAAEWYEYQLQLKIYTSFHKPLNQPPAPRLIELDRRFFSSREITIHALRQVDDFESQAAWGAAGGAVLLPCFFYLLFNPLCIINLFRRRDVEGAADDVRSDSRALAALAKPFDSGKYIDLRKGIFVGLNENRKPVYLPLRLLDKNHIEILGESGVGKSSLAGVLLSQLAAAGETVVIFDPKNDAMLPGVLARAGKTWGNFDVNVINLRQEVTVPQINPFKNCRIDQVDELIQCALGLGKSGDPKADFHRGADREASGYLSEALADGQTSMLEIIEAASQDERVTGQENLWRELRQMARIHAFKTKDGLDLEAVFSRPGVLYIVGATRNELVQSAQKLLLLRIMQILDERADANRPVCLFLDELKFILSPAALTAAGTIRDRNCHLIFAHQSLGDLDDCAGLNPNAVRGAIWGNCGIKIVYKMLDSATAKELETIAGSTAVETTSHTTSEGKNSSARRVEKGLHMPAHVFTHLPKPVDVEASVGVVIGLGPAWFLSTRFLPAGPAPRPVPAEPEIKPATRPIPAQSDEGGNAQVAPESDYPDPNAQGEYNLDDLSDLERK